MTNDMKSAFENGRGWYSTISELVERLDKATDRAGDGDDQDCKSHDELRQEIEEGPLSVMVRDGWHQPGTACDEGADEYEILLSTGGPALRIYGKLDQYSQPETAELQAQDWFTPWVRVPDTAEPMLLAYASVFYFGG